MRIYSGITALSDFRKQKLLSRLQSIHPNVQGVEAEYVHFVDSKVLTQEEDQRLSTLTSYGTPFEGIRRGSLYVVIPRPGTFSPWSSKATDIIHHSGLVNVVRLERGIAYYIDGAPAKNTVLAASLYDRMTETVIFDLKDAKRLFKDSAPGNLSIIDLSQAARTSLSKAYKQLGVALAEDEIDYLLSAYQELKRNPTDVELMMFAQVNSEHCRHKIFNADWVIDGKQQPESLFSMIKNTYKKNSEGILSAYKDNAAILSGPLAKRFSPDKNSNYTYKTELIHSVIKVETHNHPTAIAPFPGAATGIGGEIRDEAATGRGANTKMGLVGFAVSNLHIPDNPRPWEKIPDKPDRIVSALDIMLEAPIGGANFANEFGRPTLAGYFRSFEEETDDQHWGYHKPIMIAGGLGNIRNEFVQKKPLSPGCLIIQLGGPAMLIGLGGGASSSMQAGASHEDLDFASVQRGNGEMERRTQEVINSCIDLGKDNPILSIHDVGAGGLSNAVPELVHDRDRGAVIELRDIPSAEPGLSPLELWCNESQERYVIAIKAKDLKRWEAICMRERCPFAVIGTVTKKRQLVVSDRLLKNITVDVPMDVLFGKPPKMVRKIFRQESREEMTPTLSDIKLEEAIERILKSPTVGSKQFLITIGDRSVGGMVVRDQMVGPWQIPVSDVAVSANSFIGNSGEAMAIGERSPLAISSGPAAARMAVAETITNIIAADITQLSDIKLSANWMAAAGVGHEDENLFESVKAIGEEFCPALGLTIPVGKDSLSMQTIWEDRGVSKKVTAPVSLVVSGFSPVQDVSKTLTPQLDLSQDTVLIFIDASGGKSRLGGSTLLQVYRKVGGPVPDAIVNFVKQFFAQITELKRQGMILAYHDRSDGGLLATVLEMAFASRCGLKLDLNNIPGITLEKLFNEELGAVIQIKAADINKVKEVCAQSAYIIGRPTKEQTISLTDGLVHFKKRRSQIQQWWSDTSYQIQKLRDNPDCATQEFKAIDEDNDPGLTAHTTFTLKLPKSRHRPKVAILREQGVNGQTEMAAAFDRAGFTSVNVAMSDLAHDTHMLDDVIGLAISGGFSYGDVLGAGEGWAKSILFNKKLRTQFHKFFIRPETFSLGVCNGCQMLTGLKALIPGAEVWPSFLRNTSEQFEAREVLLTINETPSIFFQGMAGSRLPVPIAHGEGRTVFESKTYKEETLRERLVIAQYVDNYGHVTENYPANPNGSTKGIAALTTPDGRATIIMPHPERAFLTRQLSWHPNEWGENSPWLQLFLNAREWVENH